MNTPKRNLVTYTVDVHCSHAHPPKLIPDTVQSAVATAFRVIETGCKVKLENKTIWLVAAVLRLQYSTLCFVFVG